MTTEKAISKIDDKSKVSTLTLDDLAKICDEEGVTVRSICRTLKEGMESNFPGKYDTEKKIIQETVQPDMSTRHKYMVSAMEVLKLVKKEVATSTVINVSTLNYNEDKYKRLEESLQEEIRLRSELSSNSSHRGKIINVESRV